MCFFTITSLDDASLPPTIKILSLDMNQRYFSYHFAFGLFNRIAFLVSTCSCFSFWIKIFSSVIFAAFLAPIIFLLAFFAFK